jgi:hypothetical protein
MHASPAFDQYSKVGCLQPSDPRPLELRPHPQMSDGAMNLLRNGRSNQLYISPMSMDTMPMFLYPGASTASDYSSPGQHPYDNL